MIRRLTADDLAAWKIIRRAALEIAPHAFGRTLASFAGQTDAEHLARLSGSAVFGAFQDGQIIGSAGWHAIPHDLERHRGRLTSVFVAPAGRGTGTSDALLAVAIEDARPNVLQLELDVGVENTQAIALYRRHGFDIIGTLPRALCHGGVFVDEHLMLLRLDA